MTTATTLPKLIALEARLTPGDFSGEIYYTVTLADGQQFNGAAPPHFCWVNNRQLREKELTGVETGRVAAQFLDVLSVNEILIELPWGPRVAVDVSTVKQRPADVRVPNQEYVL